MRYAIISVCFCLIFLLSSFKTLNSRKESGVFTVVIDAGHGGHDPGCQYGGAKEKNITLAVALKLGKFIKDNCKDVNVIFTRESDVFVELWERADIANRNGADVFISVHVNANPSTSVNGTETYTMGLHKTEDNLEVAKRENEVVLMENDYSKKYDGYDPNSPEATIIFSLYQNNYCAQSIRLASKIEGQFKSKSSRVSRGVKQAGFVVLWKTAMPSVLVETGFLSNTPERKYLCSEAGQNALASNIYKDFRDFKEESTATRK